VVQTQDPVLLRMPLPELARLIVHLQLICYPPLIAPLPSTQTRHLNVLRLHLRTAKMTRVVLRVEGDSLPFPRSPWVHGHLTLARQRGKPGRACYVS
jgi:hypothetical protein